uniref:Uncharacterized protein n=1 Tax=Oryza brachyantha TaxID=4533 RepID=J3N570_ORYBR
MRLGHCTACRYATFGATVITAQHLLGQSSNQWKHSKFSKLVRGHAQKQLGRKQPI